MGRGRWCHTPAVGMGKALVLVISVQIGAALAGIPVVGIGLLAGRFF